MSRAGLSEAPRATSAVVIVRRFNRFYFKRMAPIRRALVATGFQPAELRVMRELGWSPWGATSAWLVRSLPIDAGQLSRILAKFRAHGFVVDGRAEHDRRIKEVELTPRGFRAHRSLERTANDAVAEILSALTGEQKERLVAALETVEALLGNPELPRAPAR
jgi:DNA-binding MarR family transcriptional regulator